MIPLQAVVVVIALAQEPLPRALAEDLPVTLSQEARKDDPNASDLFDFDHAELGVDVTALFYSSEFKAHADFGGTILARANSPWFSRSVLGLDHDDFGAFFQLTIGHLDRNRLDNLKNQSGATVFATLGMDYSIYRDETWLFSADLGLQFGYFGGVTDVHNGVALEIGLRSGVQVADHLWVTFSPEMTFGNSGDKIYFLNLGVLYSF